MISLARSNGLFSPGMILKMFSSLDSKLVSNSNLIYSPYLTTLSRLVRSIQFVAFWYQSSDYWDRFSAEFGFALLINSKAMKLLLYSVLLLYSSKIPLINLWFVKPSSLHCIIFEKSFLYSSSYLSNYSSSYLLNLSFSPSN